MGFQEKNKMRTAIFGIFFCFFIADGSQVNKRGTLVSSLLHREYARLQEEKQKMDRLSSLFDMLLNDENQDASFLQRK